MQCGTKDRKLSTVTYSTDEVDVSVGVTRDTWQELPLYHVCQWMVHERCDRHSHPGMCAVWVRDMRQRDRKLPTVTYSTAVWGVSVGVTWDMWQDYACSLSGWDMRDLTDTLTCVLYECGTWDSVTGHTVTYSTDVWDVFVSGTWDMWQDYACSLSGWDTRDLTGTLTYVLYECGTWDSVAGGSL